MSNERPNIDSILNMSVENVLNTDILILESDNTAADATARMKEKNARSVLITHSGEAIGLVSKTDVLFKVMAQGKNPAKIKLREIMSSPVISLSTQSTIEEALAIMDKHVVRQVIISSGPSVIGIVTRDNIFDQIHRATLSVSETAISGTPVCIINPKAIVLIKDQSQAKLACPYCSSPFDDKEALSKHIDRIHGGSGLLEGDARRMLE
ncbi:MAG: CBS domain-containing protein [Nitrososphaerales archaeon]